MRILYLVVGGLVIVGSFRIMSKKQISDKGLDQIKRHEGLSLEVYLDIAGLSTIGYGHLIKDGESFDVIDIQTATELLRDDVRWAEKVVNDLVDVKLTQNMFDALVSLVFNIGAGNFKSSTLLKELNAGNYQDAWLQFNVWNKARIGGVLQVSKGLVNRRASESQLFFA